MTESPIDVLGRPEQPQQRTEAQQVEEAKRRLSVQQKQAGGLIGRIRRLLFGR